MLPAENGGEAQAPGADRPRVVSLLPSATEILCAIGGAHLLVGRSHECDFPENVVRSLPVLTSAKTSFVSSSQIDADVRARLSSGESLYRLDTAMLARLRPDVILTQDLCGVCSINLDAVRAVAGQLSPAPTIISLNPSTMEDVLDDHLRVGEAVGLLAVAEAAVVEMRERMYAASDFVPHFAGGPAVAFLEWTDPLFVGGHWTPQLIERAGGHHPLNPTAPIDRSGAAAGPIGQTLRAAGKSVRVPPEVLVATRPDIVIVCPCGLTLEQTRREARALSEQPWWKELPAVRTGRVALVDGNQMFNRPGPRLVDAFEFLVGLLNDRPEVVPVDFPWRRWSEAGER
ncbi:MAG: ABC transporter substrate-binding protein [Pyrinomonadaceae bacterium]|nr:ABC transporter substrate-binding protein [Phycisphaerales bacterium]